MSHRVRPSCLACYRTISPGMMAHLECGLQIGLALLQRLHVQIARRPVQCTVHLQHSGAGQEEDDHPVALFRVFNLFSSGGQSSTEWQDGISLCTLSIHEDDSGKAQCGSCAGPKRMQLAKDFELRVLGFWESQHQGVCENHLRCMAVRPERRRKGAGCHP